MNERPQATAHAAGQSPVASAPSLERGRDAYANRRWDEAFRLLALADELAPLGGEDLERLASSAYLVGRDDDYLATLERAHHDHAEARNCARAARCAFWLGLRLLFRGETGAATGWLARAQRLLENESQECAERGYLLIALAAQQIIACDLDAAFDSTSRAIEIGDLCGEADLSACARHQQGHVLLAQGRLKEGLSLMDEAMVAVTSGELSPLLTGLIYCSVIDGCQQVYAMDRAREWTDALASWCDEQPDLVAFTGVCRAHRAEIMRLHGAWEQALEEARRAAERCMQARNRQSAAASFYQLAEVHRLRGEFAAAEAAYRDASQWGWEPQPGLALMRLAQGREDLAAATIRRVTAATQHPLHRMRLLPAHVEIMLAAGEVDAARTACDELDETALRFDIGEPSPLRALAAQSRGALEVALGNTESALVLLRRACDVWHQLEAPYLVARVRVLTGLACITLGDEDGGRLELDAARAAFEKLGAKPDLIRAQALLARSSPRRGGLSERELQVLRLVAAGKTNKRIATQLKISERTIDRHVSNIFAKLDVETRAAATAYAYEHHLV